MALPQGPAALMGIRGNPKSQRVGMRCMKPPTVQSTEHPWAGCVCSAAPHIPALGNRADTLGPGAKHRRVSESCPEQAEGCFCSPSKLTCPPAWSQLVGKGAEGAWYLCEQEAAQHLCVLRANVYPMGMSSEPQSPAGWSCCWAGRETAWRLVSVRNIK